jgi:hypothetical protein
VDNPRSLGEADQVVSNSPLLCGEGTAKLGVRGYFPVPNEVFVAAGGDCCCRYAPSTASAPECPSPGSLRLVKAPVS